MDILVCISLVSSVSENIFLQFLAICSGQYCTMTYHHILCSGIAITNCSVPKVMNPGETSFCVRVTLHEEEEKSKAMLFGSGLIYAIQNIIKGFRIYALYPYATLI